MGMMEIRRIAISSRGFWNLPSPGPEVKHLSSLSCTVSLSGTIFLSWLIKASVPQGLLKETRYKWQHLLQILAQHIPRLAILRQEVSGWAAYRDGEGYWSERRLRLTVPKESPSEFSKLHTSGPGTRAELSSTSRFKHFRDKIQSWWKWINMFTFTSLLLKLNGLTYRVYAGSIPRICFLS